MADGHSCRRAGKAGAACAAALAAVGVAAAATTTGDGAFTVAQAERGRQVYEDFCVNCHEIDFYRTKLAVWQNASVGELFEALSVTMPSANPGGLASAQYLDVLAYILSITGSPAGIDELTLATMNSIEIITTPIVAGP